MLNFFWGALYAQSGCTGVFPGYIPCAPGHPRSRTRISGAQGISGLHSPLGQNADIVQLEKQLHSLTSLEDGALFLNFINVDMLINDSVDRLMSETHELGGSTIAVDRATPKEETTRQWGKSVPGGYGAYNAYMSAATRYAALGSTTLYDHPSPGFRGDFGSSGMGSGYGSGNSWPPHGPGSMIGGSPLGVSDRHAGYGSGGLSGPLRGMGKKIFVGRLPQEATSEDLRQYFSNFGRILDVYVPKDSKRTGHRGFGFVTFAEDGVADRISRRSHQILGHERSHQNLFIAVISSTVGMSGRKSEMKWKRIGFSALVQFLFGNLDGTPSQSAFANPILKGSSHQMILECPIIHFSKARQHIAKLKGPPILLQTRHHQEGLMVEPAQLLLCNKNLLSGNHGVDGAYLGELGWSSDCNPCSDSSPLIPILVSGLCVTGCLESCDCLLSCVGPGYQLPQGNPIDIWHILEALYLHHYKSASSLVILCVLIVQYGRFYMVLIVKPRFLVKEYFSDTSGRNICESNTILFREMNEVAIDSATPQDDGAPDNLYGGEGRVSSAGGIGGSLRGPASLSGGGYDWGSYGNSGVGPGPTAMDWMFMHAILDFNPRDGVILIIRASLEIVEFTVIMYHPCDDLFQCDNMFWRGTKSPPPPPPGLNLLLLGYYCTVSNGISC
eukprot:Gb_29115 [translate_table: standard]